MRCLGSKSRRARVTRVRNPRPAVTVNDARLARGEGSRATSRKP